MFKIDKSSVEFQEANRFIVVVPPQREEEAPEPTVVVVQPPEAEEAPASLLDEARIEAHRIVAQAQEQAEQVHRDAFRKGYAEGAAELAVQKEANRRDFEELIAGILEQIAAYTEQSNAAFEQDVLNLSFAIAKKVIHDEFDNNKALFEQLLKRTIRLNSSDEKFIIRVHPDQYAEYFQSGSDWLKSALSCAPFKVAADAALPAYGLVMETDAGNFRTGLDVQLKRLKEALGAVESAQ